MFDNPVEPEMKMRSSFLIAIIAVALPTLAAAAEPQCIGAKARVFAKKRDLPAGAIQAIGVPMAEVGGRFLVTDAGPVSNLPDRRFVSGRQTGCAILLRYEKGGYAHTFETLRLKYISGHWMRAMATR